MSLLKYDSYRDSGVGWLGEVPAHWEVLALKRIARLQSGDGITSDEIEETGTYPVFGGNGLRGFTEDFNRDGEFALIGRQGALCGNVNYARGRIWASEHAIVAMPMSETSTVWLGETLRTMNLNQYSVSAAQPGLSVDSIGNLRCPRPPFPEQVSIAAFLDRETGKVDALVEEQRRLIELLTEKRQAVISHAVTKGLDPAAPMKDSGVEWLGEAPAHWDVAPLMRLTEPGRDIMYGIVLPGPDVGEGVPIVKGGDVKSHRLKLEFLNRTTPEIELPFARARLRPNDIVYSIRGTIGDAEPVPVELLDANITQDVARISPRDGISNRWLLHVMRARPVFVQLEQRSLGAAVRGINIFDLKRARIPVPPRAEQDAIANHLDEHVDRFERLSREAEQAVTLLHERRAALIASAVTGKIDVRGISSANAEAA